MAERNGTEATSASGIARCLHALAEEARDAGLPRTAHAISAALLACQLEMEMRGKLGAQRGPGRILN